LQGCGETCQLAGLGEKYLIGVNPKQGISGIGFHNRFPIQKSHCKKLKRLKIFDFPYLQPFSSGNTFFASGTDYIDHHCTSGRNNSLYRDVFFGCPQFLPGHTPCL
jgi:hypothetical protein